MRRFICDSCRSLGSGRIPTRTWTPFSTRRNIAATSKLSADKKSSVDDSIFQGLDSMLGSRGQRPTDQQSQPYPSILGERTSPETYDSRMGPTIYPPPHTLNVMVTKRNTHMTLSAPPPPKTDAVDYSPTRRVLLSYSTGNLGFRKAGRGSYDAAFQLAAFTFKKIQEGAMLRNGTQLEVVLRGFHVGRDAVCKAIMGQEGRLIRNNICAFTDATRLKIGGSRSPRPRRLG